MKKRLVRIVLVGLLSSCTWMTQFLQAIPSGVPVNTSHSGPIYCLEYSEAGNLLVTGGEDGTVRIWDLAKEKLLHRLNVSHRPVKKIAVRPGLSQVAVLEGDNLSSSTLSVWDWNLEVKLFSIEMKNQLLFLTYSSKGNYLLYSKADFNSLAVIDSETGRQLPYLRQGFGIVSFIVASRNEENVMTYQPSGLITYWNLRTGKSLKKVKTLPNLTSIRISPNNRFIAAAAEATMVVVDLLSGAVTDQKEVPRIISLAVSPQGNEITAIAEKDNETVLKRWYFNGKTLNEIPVARPGGYAGFSSLNYGKKGLYLADPEGRIVFLSSWEKFTLIFQNNLLSISDLAFFTDYMAAGSSDHIILFLYREGSFITDKIFKNPLSAPTGLDFLDEKKILLWRKGEEPGEIMLLNLENGAIEAGSRDFNSPIIQLEISGQGIITVEKSGLGKILDLQTLATGFQYLSPGMNKLISAGGEVLIGGKSSISQFGSPLLRINRATGETVSIPDPRLFIYDLLYDGRMVFSLGVERNKNETTTYLKVHTGPSFETEKVLFRFKGEDLGASITTDRKGSIYTSLGFNASQVLSGGRVIQLEKSEHVPRKLFVFNGKLFSLNRSSSVTVWDLSTGRILFEFYIFKDLSWGALSARGEVYASPGAKQYLGG